MTERERDRIECAIRHIQTAVDVDPWAVEIAVEAMKKQISSSRDHENDLISRQAAIDDIRTLKPDRLLVDAKWIEMWLKQLPSSQPERTCVNCGRTVNNGGWDADGGTRCPIEEHYALPKDGYCHLWEKRNVTDDDCPERREE